MRKAHLLFFTASALILSISHPASGKKTFTDPLIQAATDGSVPAEACLYGPNSLAPYAEAKARVDNYEAMRRSLVSIKNLETYSFKISITELDCYITSATLKDISFLHFILGQEVPSVANPRPPLRLYIAGVNSAGNHIYVQDAAGSYSILQCNPSSDHILPVEGTPPVYTTGTYNHIVKAFGTAMVAGGAQMVTAYYSNAAMNRTASSFTYNYNNFLGYINDAKNKGCDSIQFFLAQDCGRLTLVILGMKGNIPCYINDPEIGVSILEHCSPCPTCYEINSAIPTLEPPVGQ